MAVIRIIYTNIIYYTQSKYSGKWRDEIYDEKGNIIKRDIFYLKHHKRNNRINGKISRIAPVEQIHRKWKCTGVLNGEHLILTFWSESAIKSDGCIYAVLKDDYIYEGLYLKFDNNNIEKIKIRMIKDNGD